MKKTLKIAGIIAGHIPVLLVLILIIAVLASISSAAEQEPKTAPIYEYKSTFEKIDDAIKRVDLSYALGESEPRNRYFYYASYLTLFAEQKPTDVFIDELINIGYNRVEIEEPVPHTTFVEIEDEDTLFSNLQNLVGRSITDKERENILDNQDMLSKIFAGKFLPPLFNQDFLKHIVTPFGNGQNGVTISFEGIEKLSARAIENGTVLKAAYDQTLGNYVLLKHPDGYQSLYAHLYECNVKVGDDITVGHMLGKISDSGLADKPCLYLEIRLNDEPIDPIPLFKPQQTTTTVISESGVTS